MKSSPIEYSARQFQLSVAKALDQVEAGHEVVILRWPLGGPNLPGAVPKVYRIVKDELRPPQQKAHKT